MPKRLTAKAGVARIGVTCLLLVGTAIGYVLVTDAADGESTVSAAEADVSMDVRKDALVRSVVFNDETDAEAGWYMVKVLYAEEVEGSDVDYAQPAC